MSSGHPKLFVFLFFTSKSFEDHLRTYIPRYFYFAYRGWKLCIDTFI